jgi:hypothetical protein
VALSIVFMQESAVICITNLILQLYGDYGVVCRSPIHALVGRSERICRKVSLREVARLQREIARTQGHGTDVATRTGPASAQVQSGSCKMAHPRQCSICSLIPSIFLASASVNNDKQCI